MAKHQKKRIPQLSYTENRGLGFYVSYRDPTTRTPKKHRFGMVDKATAEALYYQWVSDHLTGKVSRPAKRAGVAIPSPDSPAIDAEITPGSLLHVVSGLLTFDQSRLRKEGEPKAKGTIGHQQFTSRRDLARNFLSFLNEQHGAGVVGKMKLADLKMEDVEEYNRRLSKDGYSGSHVTKSMLVVKAIIDRAGRPEYGKQLLTWNWDSRDSYHGQPDKPVTLPTVKQLKLILGKCDVRRTALVWMAIGLGFGQGDLTVAQPEHFDKDDYDMRRGKTDKRYDRYGTMPKLVWKSLQAYLKEYPRAAGERLFVTENDLPLVHGTTDSVVQWWEDLRNSLGEACKGLNGFYSCRHLGATEFGSRPGCSISHMRRFLGHSVSSQVADRYMKPISPEYKAVVDFVRKALQSGRVSLKL